MLNATSALLRWAPPPPQHRNGILKGYQLHIKKGNSSTFHSNITLNATTTSYVLANLTLREEYSLRAVAFTTVGLGPFSLPTNFVMDPAYLKFTVLSDQSYSSENKVLSEPWFLALLGSVIVTVLILIFVGVILYRKQWARQKSLGSLQPQHYEDMQR